MYHQVREIFGFDQMIGIYNVQLPVQILHFYAVYVFNIKFYTAGLFVLVK